MQHQPAIMDNRTYPELCIANETPDVILLDHWLGETTGGNFCREIKGNQSTTQIPVIILSALPQVGQIAMDNCAEGGLSKPFDLQELQDVLEVYL